MIRNAWIPPALGVAVLLSGTAAAQEARTPADGHTVHVTAPHVVAGKVMGPYHHYCKEVNPEVLECLIYESTEPKALMVQVEYMIAKTVTRPTVRLDMWNKHYHDHALEIATGRVQVLDRSPEEAKAIAEAAMQTDGIIFHLWSHDERVPSGNVVIAQSVGHVNLTEAELRKGADEKK